MRLRLFTLLAALLFIFAQAGCSLLGFGGDQEPSSSSEEVEESSAVEDPEYPVSAFGASLAFRPGVVVSLAPSLTDKVRDLGLSDRIAGISDYCDETGEEQVRCGTAQVPDLAEIEKLSPHLVLTETALSENDAAALQQMDIVVAVVPHAESVASLKDNYLGIARLFEGDTTGAALGNQFNSDFQAKLDDLRQNALEEPKNAIYLRLLPFTAATGDTLESELMELVGLQNIAVGYTDWLYPEDVANSEEGRAAFTSLDFIYCDKRSVTIKMLEKSDFYKGLDAVLKDRYLYIDSTAFERQSLRMIDELARMEQYAKGEIPGSKEAEAAALDASE